MVGLIENYTGPIHALQELVEDNFGLRWEVIVTVRNAWILGTALHGLYCDCLSMSEAVGAARPDACNTSSSHS